MGSKAVVLEEYSKKHSKFISLLKKYGLVILFLSPFMICFLIFFVYPLFYGIYISLTNYKLSSPGAETLNDFLWYKIIFGTTGNKAYGLISEAFWRSFLHTIIFAIIMVPVAVIVPTLLAILVNSKPIGYKVFRCLIYMPSIVPLTAAGTVFVLLFLPPQTHGLLATWFPGIGPTEWFLESLFTFKIGDITFDVAYAWIPIFLMCFWGGWGSNFIIISAGLQNIPKSLYEAASIDGCGAFKKMMKVTIPGIKGQLVLCLFTTIIGYMGLYGQNYVLSSGGPDFTWLAALPAGGKTSTIIYFIQDIVANNSNFRTNLYGLGAAASIIFAISVAIITGVQMYFTRDKKSGAVLKKEFLRWKEVA